MIPLPSSPPYSFSSLLASWPSRRCTHVARELGEHEHLPVVPQFPGSPCRMEAGDRSPIFPLRRPRRKPAPWRPALADVPHVFSLLLLPFILKVGAVWAQAFCVPRLRERWEGDRGFGNGRRLRASAKFQPRAIPPPWTRRRLWVCRD